MTNKERMLHMVLDDPKLQELYDYDKSEYEDLYQALNSDYDKSEYEDLYQALNSENVIVAAVARIIKYLDGSTEESDQKKVYMTVFNYINENYIL